MTFDYVKYQKNINVLVMPKIGSYVYTLASLCNANIPDQDKISKYIEYAGTLNVDRLMYKLIEGCDRAFRNTINYRLEYFNPCLNMIERINKDLRRDTATLDSERYDSAAKYKLFEDSDIIKKMTHPRTVDDVLIALCESFKIPVYRQFQYATMLLYAEAILIYEFGVMLDITEADAATWRSMVVSARTGNSDALVDYGVKHLIGLSD